MQYFKSLFDPVIDEKHLGFSPADKHPAPDLEPAHVSGRVVNLGRGSAVDRTSGILIEILPVEIINLGLVILLLFSGVGNSDHYALVQFTQLYKVRDSVG